MIYFSASTQGFYSDAVHGARKIEIPDPAWVRPVRDVTIATGETFGEVTNAEKKPIILNDVPDMDAECPRINVDNIDCKIPVDAREITQSHYDYLLSGQSSGQIIVADATGLPVLQDPMPPTVDELAALARVERDARMADIEWRYYRHAREVRLGISPTDDLATLDAYMQALADVSSQADFPRAIAWPVFQQADE